MEIQNKPNSRIALIAGLGVIIILAIIIVMFFANQIPASPTPPIRIDRGNGGGTKDGGGAGSSACVCPSGYVQEGNSCNPSCYYEEPQCLAPSFICGEGSGNNKDRGDQGLGGQCGIENCNGLEIVCGPDPAEMCPAMYAIGDKCRQYASCGKVGGQCQQIPNSKFNACKSCVESCIAKNKENPDRQFECENRCE